MRTSIRVALTSGLIAAALSSFHCAGVVEAGTPDGGPPPPANNLPAPMHHRPTAAPCSTVLPTPLTEQGADGTCSSDSDCTTHAHGRCLPTGFAGAQFCKYEACLSDTDCGHTGICKCGPATEAVNVCVPSKCRIDADCGSGGYCSPTYDSTCGPFDGIVGYFCHTPEDECTNDDECNEGGASGFCVYQATTGHWSCSYSFCAG